MSDHSGDADDVSGITWPGFVDIMSSVIMMFIFFVLITAVALYFHTITYKSKILAQINQMVEKQTETKASEFKQQAIEAQKKVEQVVTENKILEAKISEYEEKLKKTDSKFAESKDQKMEIDQATATVTLFFGADSISLTEESTKKLDEFIKEYVTKSDMSKITARITGSKSPDAVTESASREITVARMMNCRNAFLKIAFPKENIFVTMVGNEKVNDDYNWVKIQMVPK